MADYQINKISNNIYNIQDEYMCSAYLIIGTQKCLLIDTCMPSQNSLLKAVETICSLPVVIALTHGHFDHTGHLNEFNAPYYMSTLDNELIDETLIPNIINIKDRQVFDLGDKKIVAKYVIGHTKGSVVFIDETEKMIFTGDAFGSGCGVWMQLGCATTISVYKQSIIEFINYIETTYKQKIDSFSFYGGHLGQEKTGRLGYNPLNGMMIQEMVQLCDELLQEKVEFTPVNFKSFNNEQPYYCAYKHAEMIVRKSLIK